MSTSSSPNIVTHGIEICDTGQSPDNTVINRSVSSLDYVPLLNDVRYTSSSFLRDITLPNFQFELFLIFEDGLSEVQAAIQRLKVAAENKAEQDLKEKQLRRRSIDPTAVAHPSAPSTPRSASLPSLKEPTSVCPVVL